MKHEIVKGQEMFVDGPGTVTLEHGGWTRRNRYDLASILGIVKRVETSAGRGAVFEEIKKKNLLYRMVDRVYSRAGSRYLQPVFLLLYMVKCVVSAGPLDTGGKSVVSLANFPNEHRTIDRVAALVPDVEIHRLAIGRRYIVGFGQIAAAVRMFGAAARLLPFLSRLARRYSFMPAARIASALAFYMLFLRFFEGRAELRAAVVASNYSPEAAGMAAAAHRFDRNVIYANHAPVPWNGIVVQPVLSDCALFYGDVTTRTYTRRSRCTANVALIGQPGASRAMEWSDDLRTVGIFLTSGTRLDALSDLIAQIRVSLPTVRILVRDHPVTLLKNDLSSLADHDENFEVSDGRSVDEDIASCDMVVCGNSGVTLNVLSGGRPVAYLDNLDTVATDCNGFVENGLVHPFERWSDDLYGRLRAFYGTPEWETVMQGYDASYGVDGDDLKRDAVAALERYLHPTSTPK